MNTRTYTHKIHVRYHSLAGESISTFEFTSDEEAPKTGKGVFAIASNWATNGFWKADGRTFVPPHQIQVIQVELEGDGNAN